MKVLKVESQCFIESDLRLDAAYHLSDGPETKRIILKSPFPLEQLNVLSSNIYLGNIFKRVFVDRPEVGIPYVTASDMIKSNVKSGKFLSKKYTTRLDQLKLKSNWILISCSGTLGNVVFTNSDFEESLGTHDLIRVIPNKERIFPGFLYAYLASRFGHSLLIQSSYGGVVKHIEPHHISSLLVPIFPNSLQKEIHQLIETSSKLKAEANSLLERSNEVFTEQIGMVSKPLFRSTSIAEIKESYTLRFEANFHQSIGSFYIQSILSKLKYKLLFELVNEISRPGIFKRVYVKNGIPFLGGGELMKFIPSSEKQLSKTKTPNLSELIVKKDWILVTCGGTIGHSAFVDDHLSEKALSQHILRIKGSKIDPYYLFAFINSNIGKEAIQSFSYGSVIPQIEPHHIGRLPIPILDQASFQNISELTKKYVEKLQESKIMELKAISKVENEIASWQ